MRKFLPLAVLCVGLILLASAERRLWEADFNRADLVELKNGETSKVVTLLTDIDRAPVPGLVSLGPATEAAGCGACPTLRPTSVVEHPESRAPPR